MSEFELQAAKRKAPKAKAPADPNVKPLVDLFHDEFKERFGFKPDPRQFGRLAKDIKLMLASWSRDELSAVIQLFFRTRDPQVLRSDYSPAAFLRLAQYLRVRSIEPDMDPRTSQTAEAIRRATRRG